MQLLYIYMQFLRLIGSKAQHEAQQSATKNNVIDFKGFFSATRRNMTASEKAQHNTPLTPFRG
ncbi:hypothetical protein [Arsenophonus nasoniae]|uniref:hypothetical protein n=1 Tax=Arsenophonus nasoniae TaxID=638 RepID=UPI0024695D61|nr:hypothetical protein [Arsenophonus nasoniae]